ncbi:MAG: Ig domain-containing protein [Clostridiaceae bacterium]
MNDCESYWYDHRKNYNGSYNCEKYWERFLYIYTKNNDYEQKPVKKLCKELEKLIGKQIQLILSSSPPAAKPPNITGTLIHVDKDIVKIRLKGEHDSYKEGVYQTKYILGFVPLSHGESGGCGNDKEDENDAIDAQLEPLVGKRIELFVKTSSASPNETNMKGILLEVKNGLVKMQLDQSTPSTSPEIVIYKTSEITGFSDLSDSSHDSSKGNITVEVNIVWPDGITHPDEVTIIYIREEIQTEIQTINGVARFFCKPTGHLIIKGQDVPGFTTPIKDIKLTGKNKYVFETLEYFTATIPATGVMLNWSEVSLIAGGTINLIASIIPPNANNQLVTWESSKPSVSTVNSDGLVTALSSGIANVTVTTDEGLKTDTAIINVSSIVGVNDPASIEALPDEVVTLPESVFVSLSNGDLLSLSVVWEYNSTVVGPTFKIPLTSPEETYLLIGYMSETPLTATFEIQVNTTSTAIPVEGISLYTIATSLLVGDIYTLTPIITPPYATNTDLIWTSSDEKVASVSDGVILAMNTGLAVITVETVDGGYRAYCQISVSPVPEIDIIYATQTVFDTKEDVLINVENLVVYKNITNAINYHVKVEQHNPRRVLGENIVTIYPETVVFNLFAVTEFDTTTSFSNEYFVSMSTEPSYPKPDEQTFTTNFKVTTAVPIIPKENIRVKLEIIGGPKDNNPGNILFLFARELDKDIKETTWKDYTINPDDPDDEKIFIDEVKMTGKTDPTGNVIWNDPSEPIKLGGYLLLEITTVGYSDNLNLINPDSEDGTLLKEIHIVRDGTIDRNIIDTYTGI